MIDRNLKNLTTTESVIIRFFGVLFIIAGLIHWSGFFINIPERAPYTLSFYFNSLIFFDILTGVGMLFVRPWAIVIALLILVTQIPAHLFMIYLDIFEEYRSGFPILGRVTDITFLVAGLLYLRNFFLRKATRNTP